MYANLYNHNETDFDSLGLGVLKDAVVGKVTHERNGQYDLVLEYPVDSRLAKSLKKNKIIKADAGKRFKGQLFRIFKTNKTLADTIKVYANHISYDLQDNFVPKIDLKNVSCINALNSIKDNAAFEVPFTFFTDITHTGNFNIERVDCLSCLGGTEGSIIDTYGNGANIVRDNFNISIMQNYGEDNNVLIAYKKNMLNLDADDEGDIITGIYPFFISQDGINSQAEAISTVIELPEKYIYRSDYKNFKKQKIIPVDFSNDSSVNSVDKLREKANKYFSNASAEEPLNIKVDFLDETSLSDVDNISQLKMLDVYDSVIVRHLGIDINYKSKINKVVYDFISEEYESLEIGGKRTNLATDTVSREESFKKEINKTNNFWQQSIEHATSQITGNSGGYVKMYPPNKPSEIFIMDNENENLATNVLRINKEGIGFSKNGINGNFETAWTSKGVFYANWITAGVLSAIMLQNLDGSLQIDLGSSKGIMTRKNGKNAIELAGTIMKFYDWEGEGAIGQLYSSRVNGQESVPGIALANKLNSFLSLSYEKDNNYYSYVRFDKDNIDNITESPITFFEDTDFRNNQVWFGYNINSIYNSVANHLINKVKNNFIIADRDSSISRLDLGKNVLNLYDSSNNNSSSNRYCMISPEQTFFGSNGQKYFNCDSKGFSFWQGTNDIFYTTVAGTIQSDLPFHINGNLTVSGNKNCVQKTKSYGDRLFYSVEDCESYLTDRSMELFTVEEIVNNGVVTYERVILLDNIFKESTRCDLDYTVEVIKQSWGDYRIKEQNKDYFIVEADRPDFTFKYIVTAKRTGFETVRNEELYTGCKYEDNTTNTEYWRLYINKSVSEDL